MSWCLIKQWIYLHGVILFKNRDIFTFVLIHSSFSFLLLRFHLPNIIYEGVSRSFRTGRLERELQMVHLSATTCSCIAIFWVSLVSFAALTLCVASQRVFIVIVYFVSDSVRKLLDTPSYLVPNCAWIWSYFRYISAVISEVQFTYFLR
jgi:hypothetical protein